MGDPIFINVASMRKGQREDGARGHQVLIWVIVIMFLVLGLLTLPFCVPVTLAVGEHTLVVRPWGPRSQWQWSRTPNWGVTTVTFT
jgi:hypothetical protein